MADTKTTALGAVTPELTDIIPIVDDPGGTPVTGKVTLTALQTLLVSTAGVASAGALMDSEVVNLPDIKSFDPADYATATQGSTADSAQQPPTEGAFVDGDKTKLNGIETGADVTDETNVKAALDGATTDAVTPTATDKFLILDSSDDDNLKHALLEILTLGANQYAANDSAGTAQEVRTDKRTISFAGNVTADGTYPIGITPNIPLTATNVIASTVGGTCSYKIQKGGADINGHGTPIAITTGVTDTASTEAFAADSKLTLVVSSASSLTGLYVSIETVRTAE